jgi:hypothetical protein
MKLAGLPGTIPNIMGRGFDHSMVRNAMSGAFSLILKKCLVTDFLLNGSWGHTRYMTQNMSFLGVRTNWGPLKFLWAPWFSQAISFISFSIDCHADYPSGACHVYSLTHSLTLCMEFSCVAHNLSSWLVVCGSM